jgi:hypothetical protein
MDLFHVVPYWYWEENKGCRKLAEASEIRKHSAVALHLIGSEWILDKSPFVPGVSLNMFYTLIERYCPAYIIIPDALQDHAKTCDLFFNFFRSFDPKKCRVRPIFIPMIQGKTHSRRFDMIQFFIRNLSDKLDHIRLGIPKYMVDIKKATPKEMATTRIKFVAEVRTAHPSFEIHCAGANSVAEINALRGLGVTSLDTSIGVKIIQELCIEGKYWTTKNIPREKIMSFEPCVKMKNSLSLPQQYVVQLSNIIQLLEVI